MAALQPFVPAKPPNTSPLGAFAPGGPSAFAARHHALQLAAWAALEAFPSTFPSFLDASEVELTVALSAHLSERLVGQGNECRHWHPLVVKTGAHSLVPGVAHKATATATPEEVIVIDCGVILDGLEIDCGLTVGLTARGEGLARASAELTRELIGFIVNACGQIPPAEAYRELERRAAARGLTQIAASAGHRVGPYPTPKRETKIRADDPAANFVAGAWMVEVHVSDGAYAAFHEDCFYLEG